VIRGDEAWARVYAANSFNEPPGPGEETLMTYIVVDYTGEDAGVLSVNQTDVDIVSNDRIYSTSDVRDTACCLLPRYDFELLSGGHGEGWFAWSVPIDPNAMLKLGEHYFALD
jgi:hypothetical protein